MTANGKRSVRARVLELAAGVPRGRVAAFDLLARESGTTARHVATILSSLSEDERQVCPWHRIVAKGGALGHGPGRETQFARLAREGVLVSPAGVVQDMGRVAIADVNEGRAKDKSKELERAPPPAGLGRSRGMKLRPGT